MAYCTHKAGLAASYMYVIIGVSFKTVRYCTAAVHGEVCNRFMVHE